MIVLSCNNLYKSFGIDSILENICFSVNEGDKIGIIGVNGTGKTTLMKIISGEYGYDEGDIYTSKDCEIGYLEQNTNFHSNNTIFEEVLEVFKPLIDMENYLRELEHKIAEEGSKSNSSILEKLMDDYSRHLELFAEKNGYGYKSEAKGVLKGLGFKDEDMDKPISILSGGEKTRVLLGKLLLKKPTLLLLDEPTNHLDFQSINWLNNFIMDLEDSIVIVVSHDRHFLNQICTNIVDVDFGKIQMYVGNYDFWYESSQLALQLQKDQNKKTEEKIAQLKEFIARFSSNASKAKQATSRKKQLDKLQVEDIQPSRRRYPYVGFTPEREIGNEVLEVEGLTKTVDGVKVLDNVSFRLDREDKVAFMGDEIAITTLFNILMGVEEADAGTFKWGVTTSQSYLPKNHNQFFDGCEYSLVDWLRQFSEEKSESFIRGFLGRMLFSGEEALKQAHVLSGGEKVRCMLSRMMLSNSNVLVLDDPTNHLDLESITSVNKGLEKFPGVMLFSSHDHEMIQTLANRIIEITPGGIMDRKTTLEEYLENKDIQAQLKKMYAVNA